MNGNNDPANRLPLWPFGFDPNKAALAPFLAALNSHRSASGFYQVPQTEEWAESDLYAFSRGSSTLVVLSNVGASGSFTRTIKLDRGRFRAGTELTDVLTGRQSRLQVQADGTIALSVRRGQPLVLTPVSC